MLDLMRERVDAVYKPHIAQRVRMKKNRAYKFFVKITSAEMVWEIRGEFIDVLNAHADMTINGRKPRVAVSRTPEENAKFVKLGTLNDNLEEFLTEKGINEGFTVEPDWQELTLGLSKTPEKGQQGSAGVVVARVEGDEMKVHEEALASILSVEQDGLSSRMKRPRRRAR